jgi:hypothetical protein
MRRKRKKLYLIEFLELGKLQMRIYTFFSKKKLFLKLAEKYEPWQIE